MTRSCPSCCVRSATTGGRRGGRPLPFRRRRRLRSSGRRRSCRRPSDPFFSTVAVESSPPESRWCAVVAADLAPSLRRRRLATRRVPLVGFCFSFFTLCNAAALGIFGAAGATRWQVARATTVSRFAVTRPFPLTCAPVAMTRCAPLRHLSAGCSGQPTGRNVVSMARHSWALFTIYSSESITVF